MSVSAEATGQVGWEKSYETLRCTMVQRVRIAARLLPGNLQSHSEDLPELR
jgi:hypothetical protein